jgi:DNA-binding GntR family transcriptional regulator
LTAKWDPSILISTVDFLFVLGAANLMPPIATQNSWSLRKEIFTYLSNQIECGALTPGSLINVRKLTEELNVSRTPLREALAQLEIQGLVSILPQRGVRINVLTYEDLLNLFEIIGTLESQVVFTVFDQITDKKIDQMKRFNRAMEQAIDKGKNRNFHETNIRFHKVFLDLSGNHELTNYVSGLKLRLFGFALKSYRDRFKRAIIAEHDVFIALLKEGDRKSAADYLKDVHWKFNYPDNFIRPDTVNNSRAGNV